MQGTSGAYLGIAGNVQFLKIHLSELFKLPTTSVLISKLGAKKSSTTQGWQSDFHTD